MSPFQRTKQFFVERGCDVVKLESFNYWAKRRVDVWGADMLVRQGRLLLAIQCTDDTSHSKHVVRALGNIHIKNWLKTGVRYCVYSWGKKGPRGKRKTYQLRVTDFVLDGNDKVKAL